MAILQYINDEELTCLTGAEKIAFLSIKAQIDRDAESYETVKGVRSEAGKKGAEKRWSKEKDMANAIFAINENGKNGNCYKNKEKDKEKEKEKDYIPPKSPKGDLGEGKAKRNVIPPSVEDVKAYCMERNNGIDAEEFVDFYASKGWKVGKDTMKDWEACIRTWERKRKQRNSQSSQFRSVENIDTFKPKNLLL